MSNLVHRARVGLGWTAGVLFMAAVMAALIFGFLPITDLGPLTGIWLGFVIAGYVILGVAVVAGWYWYPRETSTVRSEDRGG